MAQPPNVDGRDGDWKAVPKWNGTAAENSPSGEDRPRWQHTDCSPTFKDASPWVNNGKDWQTVFKTGDSVDLQLGTDPAANPKRTGAVPGDLRLLIAPSRAEQRGGAVPSPCPGRKDRTAWFSNLRGAAKKSIWCEN